MSALYNNGTPEVRPEEEIVAEREGNGYILRGVKGRIGQISYTMADADTWIIDHTSVDGEYRGRGLARQLLNFVVEDAREKGRKIIPSCSYALQQFQADPSLSDVWAEGDASNYSDSYSSNGVESR
ncbi:GNAT family N-acetyltransferase [Cohnella sp. GCM10012308]|uniref:GNAT family N-acetyltransferase n=1 Tax=Cohnella sp. GCM10012308 TaxID=3317329 RepID=UPI003621C99B